MLLRSALRSAAAGATHGRSTSFLLSSLLNPAAAYSAKAKTGKTKSASTANRKGKTVLKGSRTAAAVDDDDASYARPDDSASYEDLNLQFELPKDPLPPTYDPALDVGAGGRPLFSFAPSFAPLTHKDSPTYIDFTLEQWNEILPEGLPEGMVKEFEDTRRCAVLVRQSFLDLRDNFRRIVDPAIRPGGKSELPFHLLGTFDVLL